MNEFEQPLDNIYEGLASAERILLRDIARETRPEIKADLEDDLAHVSKARQSHTFLAGILP